MVSHGVPLSVLVRMRLPIGSPPGQYCPATVSSTTTTCGEPAESLGRMARSLRIGVPMAEILPEVGEPPVPAGDAGGRCRWRRRELDTPEGLGQLLLGQLVERAATRTVGGGAAAQQLTKPVLQVL
jgi:hypothetical protein